MNNINNITIEPCCEGCGNPYAQAKSVHPLPENPEAWFCEQCAAERAQTHEFRPDAKQLVGTHRELMTNGEYAERAAITVCDYSGACNPDDHNIADLIADLGHFSDREGHNFRAVLRRAIRHWETER